MNYDELERLFDEWVVGDTMCDAKQAEYDYVGCVEEDEDIADWTKQKRMGAIKVG